MGPYDAAGAERDACGIGFVVGRDGTGGRDPVVAALEALCRLAHRGGIDADGRSGDGAGVLTPIPRRLLGTNTLEAGRLGVAMVFADPGDPGGTRSAVERACRAENLVVARWREVPVEEKALGDRARRSMPLILQAVLHRPALMGEDAAERAAFRARRRIESHARMSGRDLYIASLSFRTVTYKAMCAAEQLTAFYPDLADDRFEGWFALFHQRYSTNTAPAWERAQPFRMLAHNGEINTIRGNVAWMRAREGNDHSGNLPAPVLSPGGSDSAMLDEALELLVRGGRGLAHSAAMLVPPAWEATEAGPVKDFFAYHAARMEPWDGPAGLVMTDGVSVAAGLDRNGLRPLRVAVCEDGLVACASEAGAVDLSRRGRVRRLRLGPGQMMCVGPGREVLFDDEVKRSLAARRPYGKWGRGRRVGCSPGSPPEDATAGIVPRGVAAGWTKEETTVVLRPAAAAGSEPDSSMGDDTPPAPLAAWARPVFSFLKQRFAQVTNPPLDHLRERHVMSLTTLLGPRPPLLEEAPEREGLRRYPTPVLYPSAVADLERGGAAVLDATFDPLDGPEGLEAACTRLGSAARGAVLSATGIMIVSDRASGPQRVAVPSALAAGFVHHSLLRAGLRARAAIVVEADDVRESHHVACLLTNGADAVSPRLAFETVATLATSGRLGGGAPAEAAGRRFATALEGGLLKSMARMGISVLDSYRGAQVIEAIGLGPDVMNACFPGVSSVLAGLSFVELGADAINRHMAAYTRRPVLPAPGLVKFKRGGEHHAMNPDVVAALHGAVAPGTSTEVAGAHHLRRAVAGDRTSYALFASLSNGGPPAAPRDLLTPVAAGLPLRLSEVEPVAAITARFSTGAMSHGALSTEAHETLARAMHLIGAKANSGEGGEDSDRYIDDRNCEIKQVASARFGVTPAYLASAAELQIKIAQGSKPGEGGQLPAMKVSADIARLRHTVPGIGLISPPPHHDIYSIEDIAQLIYDLKQANPRATVSVKLAASEGVGTIAAGVVKGGAAVVHIAGGDGGTGASPLSSIRHAGLPWELGLADTQAALIANDLRGRARVRVDGGLKTGRDVVLAALLGADEFSFGTAALVAEGCILVRTCHRNTCPVGIATQNPVLRARFRGSPEMVAAYLTMVAEDVRALLASLGLRGLAEATGRTDLLRQRPTGDVRADSLDLSALLVRADGRTHGFAGPRRDEARRTLGDRMVDDVLPSLHSGTPAEVCYPITTADRSVGARLGCVLATEFRRRHPSRAGFLPPPVRAHFTGSAGQSFGAFISDGMELVLTGEANDYVGKGMAGGRLVIRPPAADAGDPVIVGNTVLYGATGGSAFIAGRAGERFAVRNSGAVAVVEGAGDHACEYMTGGAVVILGLVGRNLGAGMSGGEAYVYRPAGDIARVLNPDLVAAYLPASAQLESLRRIIERHSRATGSVLGARLLKRWRQESAAFVRVAPVAQVAHLEGLFTEPSAA